MTGDYNDKGARIGLMVAPLCLYYLSRTNKRTDFKTMEFTARKDLGKKKPTTSSMVSG